MPNPLPKTKEELEKIRDELILNRRLNVDVASGFIDGWDACAKLLWPHLVGLSEAHESILQEPWSMGPEFSSVNISRQALQEHGVSDDYEIKLKAANDAINEQLRKGLMRPTAKERDEGSGDE